MRYPGGGHFLLTNKTGNLQVGRTLTPFESLLLLNVLAHACTCLHMLADGVLQHRRLQLIQGLREARIQAAERQCSKRVEQARDPVEDCSGAQRHSVCKSIRSKDKSAAAMPPPPKRLRRTDS